MYSSATEMIVTAWIDMALADEEHTGAETGLAPLWMPINA